ncbi:MAG: winged helix-turn-helix transcriptional regulator [Thermomicrobiales bacterium]|nr:winged helix-turn-helix transcriptional regulator [Thermomicrobiales bacterium]
MPAVTTASVVDMHKALSDSTRFEIFRLVAAQSAPICACDIVDRFQVSQPTISHHMKVLRDAGLITVSRRGVWAYYAVDPRGLEVLRDTINALMPVQLAATR